MRVAILGGGIAGLSAAWELEKARSENPDLDYVLYESSAKLGGSIHTEIVDGCVVEGGPDSFLTEKPAAARLCHELGIGDSLIGSNDAARKTYIVVHNRLVPLPDGLMFMVPDQACANCAEPAVFLEDQGEDGAWNYCIRRVPCWAMNRWPRWSSGTSVRRP